MKKFQQKYTIQGQFWLRFALLNLLRHKNNILALTNKNQSNIKELNDKKIQIININLELGEFSNEIKEIINFRPNIVIIGKVKPREPNCK